MSWMFVLLKYICIERVAFKSLMEKHNAEWSIFPSKSSVYHFLLIDIPPPKKKKEEEEEGNQNSI